MTKAPARPMPEYRNVVSWLVMSQKRDSTYDKYESRVEHGPNPLIFQRVDEIRGIDDTVRQCGTEDLETVK